MHICWIKVLTSSKKIIITIKTFFVKISTKKPSQRDFAFQRVFHHLLSHVTIYLKFHSFTRPDMFPVLFQALTTTHGRGSVSHVTLRCASHPAGSSIARCVTRVPVRKRSFACTWRASSIKAECPSNATVARWRIWDTLKKQPKSDSQILRK